MTRLIDDIGVLWEQDTGQKAAGVIFGDIRTLADGDPVVAADLVIEKGSQHPDLDLSQQAYDHLLDIVMDDLAEDPES